MGKSSLKEGKCDVAIIGGSFCGLSAALLLGNALRKVAVIDEGAPRNRGAGAMHNVLGKEGESPESFLKESREKIKTLRNITQRKGVVEKITRKGDFFEVAVRGGKAIFSKRVLLATGVEDLLPRIPGISSFWLKNVFQCPYCAGPEVEGSVLSVYSRDKEAFFLVRVIKKWANRFTLLTDGASPLSQKEKRVLFQEGVVVRPERIIRLGGEPGKRIDVHFQGGEKESYRGIFFHLKSRLNSHFLIARLGCALTEEGLIAVGDSLQTSVPGIYAAGDAVQSVQKIATAIGSGVMAGIAIDQDLSCT